MKIDLDWGMLFLMLFVTLKLTHVIDWSWWLVTMPAWLPLCGIIVVCLISAFIDTVREWK